MDKTALAAAANYLISCQDYTAAIRDLTLVLRDWSEKRVYYAGDKECLNALVELGLEDLAKFNRIVELVESRRTSGPTLRRTEYQAEYMAQRRARMAKVFRIEALVRGKPLSPDEKRATDKRMRTVWADRKDAFLAEHNAVEWDDKLAATALFWEQIDKELEEQLATAEATPIVQRKTKRVVKPEFEPRTDFGKRIREVLQK